MKQGRLMRGIIKGRLFPRTHLFLVGMLVSMLLLSACITSNSDSNTTDTNGNLPAGPIKIGVSLSLTGDDSADGQATQQGYDTWAQYVNSHGGLLGHQVKMVYYDDGTKVDQTRANYEKLITVDKVNFVLGPFDDPQTITGAEVARQHNMAFIEGSGTGPEVFQNGLTNLFAVSLSATNYFSSFVDYILSLPADMRPKQPPIQLQTMLSPSRKSSMQEHSLRRVELQRYSTRSTRRRMRTL